jgi:hypothetical protein
MRLIALGAGARRMSDEDWEALGLTIIVLVGLTLLALVSLTEGNACLWLLGGACA